jgi:hypothetical protein
MVFDLLKRSITMLLTPTICDSLASISLVLCIFDIGMLCCYKRQFRSVLPSGRESFGYRLLFSNLAIHFADTVLFYSPSVDHRPGSDRADIFMLIVFVVSYLYSRSPEFIPRDDEPVGGRAIMICSQGREEGTIAFWLWNGLLIFISRTTDTIFAYILFNIYLRFHMGEC